MSCFYENLSKTAFVGDVIFAGSIGRTDFPRGNHEDLIHSITKKLWPLGNEVKFVPGHGSMSVLEKKESQIHLLRITCFKSLLKCFF